MRGDARALPLEQGHEEEEKTLARGDGHGVIDAPMYRRDGRGVIRDGW